MKKYKIAYFVTHPIQYQIPLLRLISKNPFIDLSIFFLTDQGVSEYKDLEFGKKIKWNIDMLSGLNCYFLKKNIKGIKFGFLNPFSLKLFNEAIFTNWDAVWFHGYNNVSLLLHFFYFSFFKRIPIIFRGESTLLCSKQTLLKNFFLKIFFKNIAAFLFISHDNKDYYLKYKINPNKLFFSPYCVDNKHFQSLNHLKSDDLIKLKKKYKIDESLRTILFVGKLIKRKNCISLLDAFFNLNNKSSKPIANLIIVGDGPEKAEIMNKVSKFKFNDKVTLLGFQNIDEIVKIYKISDIFCIPSFREPFGLVVPEAMNTGNLIIASNQVGCAKDLVKNNKNGFVISPHINEIEKCLESIILNDGLINSMQAESLNIINSWSYEQNVKNLIKALKFINTKNDK